MKRSFTDDFKNDVVEYVHNHPDEAIISIARRFDIADSTIHAWLKKAKINNGTVVSRGSGNYSSDEAKENARLRKELKDTKDALDILKKAIGILGD